uniref:Anthranilate synthase component 2 n=1 Tax=Boldia erythrosiphon TaxID=74908 RepID=A0A1Y9TM23_9RHOD|nr:anthranilate synthase component II [Boldia erythrosiphon]ARO90677.1 anthranilate synthase component II [Boldia erythrosiphon]
MILVIDNYDSFTYNLAQYIGEMGYQVKVCRNNKITIAGINNCKPDKIIISPGPGRPEEAGICLNIVKEFSSTIPILGVCLGHQLIGHFFGAEIIPVHNLMHGKISYIYHDNDSIFANIPNPFVATRYHSLAINTFTLPSDLLAIAWTQDNTIMACKHTIYPNVYGIQFHPESVLTEYGKNILKNFLELLSNDFY